jgi:hypothetical protein
VTNDYPTPRDIIASGRGYFSRPALGSVRAELERVHRSGLEAQVRKRWGMFADAEKLDWDRRRQKWDGSTPIGRQPKQKHEDKIITNLPKALYEKCYKYLRKQVKGDGDKDNMAQLGGTLDDLDEAVVDDFKKRSTNGENLQCHALWVCMLCSSPPMTEPSRKHRHLREMHALQRAELSSHKARITNKAQELKCEYCKKTFSRSWNHNRHKKNGSCPLDPRPDQSPGTVEASNIGTPPSELENAPFSPSLSPSAFVTSFTSAA